MDDDLPSMCAPAGVSLSSPVVSTHSGISERRERVSISIRKVG